MGQTDPELLNQCATSGRLLSRKTTESMELLIVDTGERKKVAGPRRVCVYSVEMTEAEINCLDSSYLAC